MAASKLDLSPGRYEMGDLLVAPVAVPGSSTLVGMTREAPGSATSIGSDAGGGGVCRGNPCRLSGQAP
jgi:hypothetical protein